MVDLSAAQLPRLTVVLTNYNGCALLETMLPSLARQSFTDFATVVVDDGSTDGSLAYLHGSWPQVEVIALSGNGGVTAAMNTGLMTPSSELVGLFNNDMELDVDCLRELVAALDAHPEAGSATPKMLDHTDRARIDGTGDELSWRGGGERRGHGERDVGQYEAAGETFAACGGAAVYRRAAIDTVGGFDVDYFAYFEDVDWGFRAQLAGFRCRYVPSALLYHRGSETLGRGITDFNGYQLWRNAIWLVAKCYPRGALVRHLPALARGQAGNLYVAIRERKLRVWARAVSDALRGLPKALRKRRAVQRSRVIPLAQLEDVARRRRP